MASAAAKIILFGEHAVVYDQPAIAIPVSDLRATATVMSDDIEQFQIVARDLNDKIIPFDGDDPLVRVVSLTCEALAIDVPSISIAVHSDIPIASGLGSGASISTAIIRALLEYTGQTLSNEVINEIVFEVEKLHHGTPSGIDNTVIVYERAVYFQRSQPIEKMQIKTPLRILVADTGRRALTRDAVGDVKRLYERYPDRIGSVIESTGQIAIEAREALKMGQMGVIGRLMLDNHTLLRELTVSSDELEILVSAAMDAGAIGAKLSGGGRGGNMIALVTSETEKLVQEALLAAGAARVFGTTLEATD